MFLSLRLRNFVLEIRLLLKCRCSFLVDNYDLWYNLNNVKMNMDVEHI